MLEDQSGSTSQENIEQDVQTDSQSGDQNLEALSQEKLYSQKQRKRAQMSEAENEKLKARLKKMEEDALAEQGKFKEMWERDKDDAEWARTYKKSKKASLLEKIPEDKREKFKTWGIDQLETYLEDTTNSHGTETMKKVPGIINPPKMTKPFNEMNELEKKAYHESIINASKS